MKKNRELTATLLDLAEKTKTQDISSIEDPLLKEQLEALHAETKVAKRNYRIMKSVVGTVVAGSGVDWSENEELCQLVLDAEE